MIEFGKTTVNLSTAPFLVKMMEQEDNEIRIIVALPTYGEKDIDGNISENSKLNDLLTECVPISADMDNMYEFVLR